MIINLAGKHKVYGYIGKCGVLNVKQPYTKCYESREGERMKRLLKLLTSLSILVIVFLMGLFLGISTPDSVKSHFANTLKKEMQISKKVFYIGDVKFSPTKYKNLYLAEVKERQRR